MSRARILKHALGAAFIQLASSRADTSQITALRVASGLDHPTFLTHAPGDFERVFILEQDGRIKILKDGIVPDRAFLDLTSVVSTGGENGLLGLAFHPQYALNGFFFVFYTSIETGMNVLARYRASNNPDIAQQTGAIILNIPDPFGGHHGGWMGFSADGFLYVAIGDGGAGDDPDNRAQNLTGELLGKILRIDVDGPDNIPANDDDDGVIGNTSISGYTSPQTNPFFGPIIGRDEIWAYGLRNPWRCSFDRETHDFYITDVGQDVWEELNFQSAASFGGENYGWRCMEGMHCTNLGGCACSAQSLTAPIHEYPHAGFPCDSITGGYVYRGCEIPDLRGSYFFADFCRGTIWSLVYQNGTVTQFRDRTAELNSPGQSPIRNISSFGEDAAGELYICNHRDGEIYKIVPLDSNFADCNNNGRSDASDICAAQSADGNANLIPDECESPPLALHTPPNWVEENRYLSFVVPPAATAGLNETAIRVIFVDLMNPQPPNLSQFPAPDFSTFVGQVRYVTAPIDCAESELPPASFKCATLDCNPTYIDWRVALSGASLHVTADSILPSSAYSIQQLASFCRGKEEACSAVSPSLLIRTQRWGDVVPPFQRPAAENLSQPNLVDVSAAVDKFKGLETPNPVARLDIYPAIPDNRVNIADVAGIVDAFKGLAYPHAPTAGLQPCQ